MKKVKTPLNELPDSLYDYCLKQAGKPFISVAQRQEIDNKQREYQKKILAEFLAEK
jgi:hypothetical protein